MESSLNYNELLNNWRKKNICCDATILAGGTKFSVHSLILYATCPNLRSHLNPTAHKNVVLHCMNTASYVVECYLDYIYTGKYMKPMAPTLQKILALGVEKAAAFFGVLLPIEDQCNNENVSDMNVKLSKESAGDKDKSGQRGVSSNQIVCTMKNDDIPPDCSSSSDFSDDEADESFITVTDECVIRPTTLNLNKSNIKSFLITSTPSRSEDELPRILCSPVLHTNLVQSQPSVEDLELDLFGNITNLSELSESCDLSSDESTSSEKIEQIIANISTSKSPVTHEETLATSIYEKGEMCNLDTECQKEGRKSLKRPCSQEIDTSVMPLLKKRRQEHKEWEVEIQPKSTTREPIKLMELQNLPENVTLKKIKGRKRGRPALAKSQNKKEKRQNRKLKFTINCLQAARSSHQTQQLQQQEQHAHPQIGQQSAELSPQYLQMQPQQQQQWWNFPPNLPFQQQLWQQQLWQQQQLLQQVPQPETFGKVRRKKASSTQTKFQCIECKRYYASKNSLNAHKWSTHSKKNRIAK